ncbi:hypothetical protein GM3708_1539 [Geminocystis sp. NIES-3708]|uniref:hypothetical protein n=1 Tax=Geminocystis sp. NIES-3708 TaxID=1615909 RepID=UPI0005FC9A02|nr:hypothetical protein [Geminocystis sp. NIES-3708]BAQ61133.1 hypothetical protein GM3708_1539 [Geminocystis sp. NIES-3708]
MTIDLSKVSGVPETVISLFRTGERNTGVKIFDQLREGLQQISPKAYRRFMELLAEVEPLEEINLAELVAKAPFSVQAEVLKAIASTGVFTRLSEMAQDKNNQKVLSSF